MLAMVRGFMIFGVVLFATAICLLLFFHRHSNCTGCLVAFDTRNKTAINVGVMALMGAFPAVFLGQLDPVALKLVHRPNMHPSAPTTSMCSLIPVMSDLTV
jgi:cytochrome c biogenesis factor